MTVEREPPALQEWMYDLLVEHTGETHYFDRIMGRFDDTEPLGVEQIDKARLFEGIIALLVTHLGSEKLAMDWILYSKVFKKSCGITPFDYIEDGQFDAILLLHDSLTLILSDQKDPFGLSISRGDCGKKEVSRGVD